MTRPTPPRPLSFTAKLATIAVALVVAVGLCEGLARAVFPAPPHRARQPALMYQTDPELGFVHVANQVGYLDDGLASINAIGVRGPLPDVNDPESLRVLAIGDSTTFGWGVNDDETYLAALERRLGEERAGRAAVVNAGVVSYDLKQSFGLLERLVPMVRPQIVLVGVFWNDLPYQQQTPEGESLGPDPSAPPGAAARPASAPATANAAPRTFRMANLPSRFNMLLRSSRLLFVLRHAWLGAVAPTGAASNQVRWEMALLEGRETAAIDRAWADVGATFSKIRGLADAGRFDVGVVVMPIRAQVEQDYPSARYQSRVRQLAEAEGFFVVDPLPRFRAATDRQSLFIPYDRMHYSPRGNALVAEAVLEALRGRADGRRAALR